MGLLGSAFKVIVLRILPVLVLLVAIFVGWLLQHPLPDGRLFATLVPLLKGYMPPTIVGHGHMKGTPPVPDDMIPEPRPAKELFVKLAGTGDQMPQNGLGMCCRPTAYDDILVERTVLWYLLLGGRMIDGAQLYLNNKAIAKGIREGIQRGIPRNEIFMTTKVPPSQFGYNATKATVLTALNELNLDYLDLMLMHAPISFIPGLGAKECSGLTAQQCIQDTWKALSDLRRDGFVRNVGVSNFQAEHIESILELGKSVAPIAVNQIQWNPWILPTWLESAEMCRKHGIAITGYNTLGGSFQNHELQTVERLNEIATKHDRSVIQVMLRWAIQSGAIVIPGTGNPKYMIQNLAVYEFELSGDDMKIIENLRHEEPGKIFSYDFGKPVSKDGDKGSL